MSSLLPPPPPHTIALLVGRERELANLRAALTAALAGHGALVLIGGEAGLGKTALAETLLAEATARGALALIGRCYDLAETPPYGPWTEALDRAPQELAVPPPDLTGGEVSQTAPFSRVRDYLTALTARTPLVLLLDDLHWADPASLDLLRVLARNLTALPALLLATYRVDELTRRHPLYQLLPILVREARAARLDLRPLEDDALETLVRARYALPPEDTLRLVTYLRDRAEGNPLYASELLRTLEEERALRGDAGGWRLGTLDHAGVPPLLRQVIDARVDRLGEEIRALLAIAAVIGQEVPFDLWHVIAGVDEGTVLAAADQALAAQLLVESPGGQSARFAHALIREALYDGLALPRRRIWHRQAAEALAAGPLPDPERVAHHFRQAGDPRAAQWLILAGERAARAYAWLTAAERLEAALGAPGNETINPRERAFLLLTLAQLWRYEDRHRGIGYLTEAEQLAETTGDPGLAAAARFDRAHLRLLADDPRAIAERAASLAAMAAALPTLEALPVEERARLPTLRLQNVHGAELYHRGALMYWLAWVGRLTEAQTLATPMLANGSGTTARGLAALGLVYHCLGRPEEAEHILTEAQATFAAAGQQYEVYYRLTDRLLVARAYYLDQPARWQHLIGAIDEAALRAAEAGRVVSSGGLRQLLVTHGAWAEVRRHPDMLPSLIIARRQGETATAQAALDRYLPHGPATEPGRHPLQHALECQQEAAALAIATGDLTTARAWLEAHDRWLDWSGTVLGQATGQLGWATYHRAAGDPQAAQAHADRALARATTPRQPLVLLAAHHLCGELATVTGRHPDALAHLDAALALADACAAPYERALTLLALAELRAARGQHAEANVALADAQVLLIPLEARPALARAAALAERLAAPAPATTPAATLPFGLTAREVEVLRLVAEGLSDAQIAERIFVSRHTVNGHLKAIYGKLGVTSRAAATRLALEQHLA